MGQTANYGLKQWEAWERPRRGEINGALAAVDGVIKTAVDSLAGQLADKSALVTGSFTGDGTEGREIDLGFAPKAVYLCTDGGMAGIISGSSSCYGGLMLPGIPLEVMGSSNQAGLLTENGFWVTSYYSAITNQENAIYCYIAMK